MQTFSKQIFLTNMASFDILFLLSIIIGIVCYWSQRTFNYWKRLGIPYIKPLPIIGNLQVIFTQKTSYPLYLSEIYSDEKMKDTPAVGIYTLNKPGLVLRDPDLIKAVLIKDFHKFSSRYANADPHGDALGANNLFFVRNPEWKEVRTKLTPVFTSGKVKQMYPLMLEIASKLESHLAASTKKKNALIADIKETCACFTTDLIATIAFGLQANSLQNPDGEFRSMGREMFEFSFFRALHFFVVFFMPNFVSTFRVKLFNNKFSSFLRHTINYVMLERKRSGTLRNDLIDVLVDLQKEAAKLSQGSKHFSKNNDFLVAQAAVFLTAGFETSSSTMTFALYELAKRSDLQERLRAEILEALLEEDNGKLSYEKIQNLEYLSMVVDEVLRLYPVLPFLDRVHIPPGNENNFSLRPYYDYEMPEGMGIFVPIYGLQRDPKFWPSPNTFDPERFTVENKKTHIPMSYLPFGTGQRNCIGSRIGLLQTKLGLVHILKNHYVTACEKTVPEMDFDPQAFILSSKTGVYLNIVNDRMYDNAATTTSN